MQNKNEKKLNEVQNIGKDEVSVLDILKYFSQGIKNIGNAFVYCLKYIASAIIGLLLFLYNNKLVLGIALILGFFSGFITDSYIDKKLQYEAIMYVQPNFGINYVVENKIKSLNNLIQLRKKYKGYNQAQSNDLKISANDYAQLESINIAEIDFAYDWQQEYQKLWKLFEVQVGENKKIDSFKMHFFNQGDFLDQNYPSFRKIYKISVISTVPTVAKKISPALLAYLSDDELAKQKHQTEIKKIYRQDSVYLDAVNDVKKIESAYLQAMVESARSNPTNTMLVTNDNTSKIQFSASKDKSVVDVAVTPKEIIVLKEGLLIQNKIDKNKKLLVEQFRVIDVIADFPEYANIISLFESSKWFFALLAFFIVCFFLIFKKFIMFLEKQRKTLLNK